MPKRKLETGRTIVRPLTRRHARSIPPPGNGLAEAVALERKILGENGIPNDLAEGRPIVFTESSGTDREPINQVFNIDHCDEVQVAGGDIIK